MRSWRGRGQLEKMWNVGSVLPARVGAGGAQGRDNEY